MILNYVIVTNCNKNMYRVCKNMTKLNIMHSENVSKLKSGVDLYSLYLDNVHINQLKSFCHCVIVINNYKKFIVTQLHYS